MKAKSVRLVESYAFAWEILPFLGIWESEGLGIFDIVQSARSLCSSGRLFLVCKAHMDSNVIEPTGRVPAPKTFDYIPPRMDADAYQVAVPQWEGELSSFLGGNG